MHMDELDRILSTDEPLTPSSGFTARVMESVHDAAAQPPPLPFPWGRFMTGVLASLASLASGAVLVTSPEASTLGAALAGYADVAAPVGYALAVAAACLVTLRVRLLFAERDVWL
jgi:hypothetical protein